MQLVISALRLCFQSNSTPSYQPFYWLREAGMEPPVYSFAWSFWRVGFCVRFLNGHVLFGVLQPHGDVVKLLYLCDFVV